TVLGSKPASASFSIPGTRPAILIGKSVVSKRSIRPIPDCPAVNRCHTGATPQPRGLTMPMPVTTIGELMVPPKRKLPVLQPYCRSTYDQDNILQVYCADGGKGPFATVLTVGRSGRYPKPLAPRAW